jgi:DNA mismatch repair protein PMS2
LIFNSDGQLIAKMKEQTTKGTKVTINNIFYTFPVKRKTISQKLNTEFKNVVELIQEYMMIYPKIRFILKNGNITTKSKQITNSTEVIKK